MYFKLFSTVSLCLISACLYLWAFRTTKLGHLCAFSCLAARRHTTPTLFLTSFSHVLLIWHKFKALISLLVLTFQSFKKYFAFWWYMDTWWKSILWRTQTKQLRTWGVAFFGLWGDFFGGGEKGGGGERELNSNIGTWKRLYCYIDVPKFIF